MNVSEILHGAADQIKRDGWWQASARDQQSGTRPVCAANAIFTQGGTYGYRAVIAAQAALIEHIGGDGLGDIWRWNDAPGRTAAEVIETLRAAAVIAAARESVAAYALGAVGA